MRRLSPIRAESSRKVGHEVDHEVTSGCIQSLKTGQNQAGQTKHTVLVLLYIYLPLWHIGS